MVRWNRRTLPHVISIVIARRVLTAFLVAGIACTSSSHLAAPPTNPPVHKAVLPVPAVHVTQRGTLHLGQLGGLTAAQEAFGNVWAVLITDGGKEQLVRADPVTGEVQHAFPLAYFPAQDWGGSGLAVGGGAVWVAGADAGFDHGVITRIDPATDAVQRIEVKGRAVEDVAFDSGSLWALAQRDTHGDADVVAIDASTGTVVSSTEFHADSSGGIFPAGSSAWTVERDVKGSTVQGGRLVQIVPGGAPQITLGGSFALPASDGSSIWTPFFGDAQAMNLASGIARIDPTTAAVLHTWKTDTVGYDLAVGEDGGIWFLAGDHLERLNPSTGETDIDVAVPGKPIFIVPTRGAIWVGTYEGDLIRFDVNDVAS